MTRIQVLRSVAVAAFTAVFIVAFSPAASAQGVVSEWKTVEAPPAPELKPVKVDVPKTALMVMDFTKAACTAGGERSNPRCLEAMPKIKELIDKARAHHMFVLFTTGPTAAPNAPDAAASDNEQTITGPPNKFDGTSDLDKILKDHGITTVIAMGTAPNGAVLFTSYGLAVHGYKVVVPVDTMPGSSPYAEASSIWGIGHDPTVANASTLTSVDMISF
jgi:nicotinamidase-related amidase